ncbi:hypothetical protein ACS0TY_026545 [Phlomoides rotata]
MTSPFSIYISVGYIDSGSEICTVKPGVFPKEEGERLLVIAGKDFSRNILILNQGIREAYIMIDGECDILLENNFIQNFAKYEQDNNKKLLTFTTSRGNIIHVLRREKAFNRILPINFGCKRGDFDAKFTNPKMQDKRRLGETLLMLRHPGFEDTTEGDIQLLNAALGKDHTYIDIDDECRVSLEQVKRNIQRNNNEDPLAWWNKNRIEATEKVKEENKYELVEDLEASIKIQNVEDFKNNQESTRSCGYKAHDRLTTLRVVVTRAEIEDGC